MKKFTKFWDRIASGYDNSVDSVYAEAYKNTIELSRKYLGSNDLVLDYACGTGITTVELAQDVSEIKAVDLSDGMITIAKAKAEEKGIRNVEFSTDDIFSEKFSECSFDAVTAFNVLYFIRDLDGLLGRLHGLLKPGGIFLSVTDCIGEKMTLKTVTEVFLSRFGVLPYIKPLKTSDLLESVENAGFKIVLEKNLFDSPPNYYIAAEKQ